MNIACSFAYKGNSGQQHQVSVSLVVLRRRLQCKEDRRTDVERQVMIISNLDLFHRGDRHMHSIPTHFTIQMIFTTFHSSIPHNSDLYKIYDF
jgi:hypothetical protein